MGGLGRCWWLSGGLLGWVCVGVLGCFGSLPRGPGGLPGIPGSLQRALGRVFLWRPTVRPTPARFVPLGCLVGSGAVLGVSFGGLLRESAGVLSRSRGAAWGSGGDSGRSWTVFKK